MQAEAVVYVTFLMQWQKRWLFSCKTEMLSEHEKWVGISQFNYSLRVSTRWLSLFAFNYRYNAYYCGLEMLICNSLAAQRHPQQLYGWIKGEQESNLPENFFLLRNSTSLLTVGFIWLAAIWWQRPNLVSQSRLGVEMPPQPQLFQDVSKLFREPKSHQLPIRGCLEQEIEIIISNCMATLASCRTSQICS